MKTEDFVEDWCLQHEMLPEDLDADVDKAMAIYTSLAQCVPGKGTYRARFVKHFNVWNWRKAVIEHFTQSTENFYSLCLLNLYDYRDFMSPTHLGRAISSAMVKVEILEAGEAEYTVLTNHLKEVAYDHKAGVLQDRDYQVSILHHYIAMALLSCSDPSYYEYSLALEREVLEKFNVLFPDAEVLRIYLDQNKERAPHNEPAVRILNSLFSSERRTGPKSLYKTSG